MSNPRGVAGPSNSGFFSWLFCCSEVAKVPPASMSSVPTRVHGTEKHEDAQRQPPVNMLPAAASISEELQNLAQLRNNGILTEAEFEAAKSKLLAG